MTDVTTDQRTEPADEVAPPALAGAALAPAVLEALRGRLLERAAALRLELAGARGQETNRCDAERDRWGDGKDAAAEAVSVTMADAEMQRDLNEWQEVEAALQRLREQRYGLCADCGAAIALPRLQTQPAALRCTACQQQAEARAAAPRPPPRAR